METKNELNPWPLTSSLYFENQVEEYQSKIQKIEKMLSKKKFIMKIIGSVATGLFLYYFLFNFIFILFFI